MTSNRLPTNKQQILVVDDEPNLVWALQRGLRDEGYSVLTAYNGATAVACAKRHHLELIILDIIMPGKDGFWVCEQLRHQNPPSEVPILFLTTRSAVADRIQGLDLGGDDYLVKPFDIGELKARVRALVRRRNRDSHADKPDSFTNMGPFTLDYAANKICVGERSAALTPREFELLEHLLSHAGEIFSSEVLLQQVWRYPPECINTGLVRWYIKCIREKIEPNPQCPIYLRTIPRQGYVIGPFPPEQV